MHRSVKSRKIKNRAASSFFTNKTAATAYTTEDADGLKQLPRRGLWCSLTVKKCVLFEGELFQWHFNLKRQDIPPDDLVRHGLELVLHLLQESLDLQHTTCFNGNTYKSTFVYPGLALFDKVCCFGDIKLKTISGINYQEEMDKQKQGFNLVHHASGVCTM